MLEADPYRSPVARLSPRQLRRLTRKLPKPLGKEAIGGVNYEIYRAKEFYAYHWENDVLYRLVIDARGSYYRYGDLPPLDRQDKKSGIYLVRAIYLSPPVEEWLSARFVPGDGAPEGVEDFDFYAYRGKPINYLMENLFKKEHTSLSNVISISRLCGIDSFLRNRSYKKISTALHHSDHLYTPVCFGLLNKQMLEDYRNLNHSCSYISNQIPEELINGFLALRLEKGILRPQFTLAAETLDIDSAEVKLIRKDYTYQFPLYFLNKKAVIGLIADLLKQGILTAETISHYLGKDGVVAEDLVNGKHFKVEQFRGLGNLLTVSGQVKGSAINGEELRILMEKVPDGPQFRLIKVGIWEESINQLLKAADKI